MTLDEIERHMQKVRDADSVGEAYYLLEPLVAEYSILTIAMADELTFWRARKAGETPWDDISSMIYPPVELAGPNRLNDKNEPCFYGATRINTALLEIGSAKGDAVQVAGFRPIDGQDHQVAIVGEMYHVYKTGHLRSFGSDPGGTLSRLLNDLPHDRAMARLYIDAFFASVLADPGASQADYMLSRALGAQIMGRNHVDGMIYPSVKDAFGLNLALKPATFDRAFRAVCCVYGRVERLREFGLVDFVASQDAESIVDDQRLVWQSAATGSRRMFNLSEKEMRKGFVAS